MALVVDQWMDNNLTSFITDLLIPLKMDLQERLQIQLLTDQTVNDIEQGCNIQEPRCMGARVLSCATAQETEVLSSVQENQNTTDTTVDESLDQANLVNDDGQIRLMSLSACMMQTFSASFENGGRQNALLAAKRCVRSHGYQWSAIRTCVWDDVLVDQPPEPQQVSSFNLLAMKASVCSELSSAGVSAIVCDLALDQYEEQLMAAPALEAQQPLAYVHSITNGEEENQQQQQQQEQQPMASEANDPQMMVEEQPQEVYVSRDTIAEQQPMGVFLNDVVAMSDDTYYDE